MSQRINSLLDDISHDVLTDFMANHAYRRLTRIISFINQTYE